MKYFQFKIHHKNNLEDDKINHKPKILTFFLKTVKKPTKQICDLNQPIN